MVSIVELIYGELRRTINANDSAGLELAEEAQYKVRPYKACTTGY